MWRIVSFVLILALAGSGTPGLSQTVDQTGPPIGGLVAPLPSVPTKRPRPAQGADAQQQWQIGRTPEEGAPVASFIDTLRTSDAAFEVILGQGRLLTLKMDIAMGPGTAVIAVGDPSIIDFQVLPNPRMIRVTGRRAGVTDMSITTADGQVYGFEVHVTYDLQLLRAQLKQIFPDAHLRLAQLREHLVVEGQARSPQQAAQILQAIEAYLESVRPTAVGGGGGAAGQDPAQRDQQNGPSSPGRPATTEDIGNVQGQPGAYAGPETGGAAAGGGAAGKARIINLIRVPGVHQVMLQVRIAEINRTGLREIGADILGVDPATGNIFGTQIAGSTVGALGAVGFGGLLGLTKQTGLGLTGVAGLENGRNTTGFGIFPTADFGIMLRALRKNNILSILAEPNLMALSGQDASFLAGGEFPVPVAQTASGGATTVTIEWKEFGVLLNFVPYVQDDETVRLFVEPEVSSIDFALGTTLVPGGSVTPGVNSRKVSTTVELRQGQTLAIAGLLDVMIDGETSRIPGLGDVPYLGPLFSNTSHNRVEKELLVLVTPYLVSPMNADQVPPLPGQEVEDPNDLEFYFLNRIEGRTGRGHRSTTNWDDPLGLVRLLRLERRHVSGPAGFSQ